jgi:hypothetical protein
VIVSMRYLIITPPSQNAKSARRARNLRQLTKQGERGKIPSQLETTMTGSITTHRCVVPNIRKAQVPRRTRHLQIARKNGQLPHKPAARVRRQRVSSATVVEPKLMFVLNLDKVNVIAPQLAKSVSPIRKIKLRKTNSQNFLVPPRQLGSTKVAR